MIPPKNDNEQYSTFRMFFEDEKYEKENKKL